jgi:hypothetical protein
MFNFFKIFSYLELKHVGFLELIFALTPMMFGYSFHGLPLSLLMWLILLLVVFIKYRKLPMHNYKPLTVFIVFWVAHELWILTNENINLNSLVEQVIFFVSIFALHPVIRIKKLIGSFNWIAIIAIIGLLYQWSDIARGIMIHPLEIPGLDMPENRLLNVSIRPSSFFMEPAAYVAFMIIPLVFALIQKRIVWAVVLMLSIFLTTSTTGIVTSFIVLAVYIFTQKIGKNSVVLFIVAGVGLFYAFTHSSAFEAGREKIDNTDIETNIRLAQGQYIVSTMKFDEMFFGTKYSTPYDYCIRASRAPRVIIYGGESIYMSTFWWILFRFGIIGLALYLNVYWMIYRKSKLTLIYLAYLCAIIFSSALCIGASYTYSLIVLLVIANNYPNKEEIQA